ncbi:ankyrin repeat-containing domain protein [Annulohypoxylon bovei var. microspora]|nr:ankyrin repeat-containing domain protein [Annulohypoxylon bovei var. microspora]
MICLPSLSTEFPVMHNNNSLEATANILTFSVQPTRFLGEKGSVDILDDIVGDLLNFIVKASEDTNISLSELSIVFSTSDLGGILVKKALLRAATDVKYQFIFTQTSLLFFFGTPHHASDVSCWEETISRIIEDTYRGLRGPWFPDRIHQLSRSLEQLRLDFRSISDHFHIMNYFQDMPESSSEILTVHKSCTELQGFNVINIGIDVTHYELHCFFHESAGEDFIVDLISETPTYINEDFRQLVQWLSLEADGIETNFQTPGNTHNLVNSIIHSEELEDSIHNGKAQLISVELEVQVDGRDFLSCFRDEIRRILPPYPGTVIACSSITTNQPSSLTEMGLLSSCLVQLLKQRPKLSSWLKATNERVLYALRIRNVELKIRTLWECLRLVFTHKSHFQGFWLIHTTGGPDQHELILKILERLQYFDELDEISWKVIIINNSTSNIDCPLSKVLSRVRPKHDTLKSSIEKDIEARLDSIIKTRKLIPVVKEKALQLLRKQPLNHKLLGFLMDTLQVINPPIPDVLASLMDSFSSTDMAFNAILDQVPRHYRAWLRTILGLLCFSRRPLSLDELAIVVAAVDCQSFEQLEQNVDRRTGEYIRELLPGIICVTSENIIIIHEDLKSFLQQSPEDAWYRLRDFHSEIMATSYNYLSLLLDKFADMQSLSVKSIVEWMRCARAAPGNVREIYVENQSYAKDRCLGFVPYAALYWYDHYLSASSNNAASELPRSWLTNPRRLKEILALRYHSRCLFCQDFCAPEEFMPLSVREALNLSESEALKLTTQLIDRQPSHTYIDIMYPPDSTMAGVARNWITSNFLPLSVSETIECYPHEIDRLFQHEEKAIRNDLSDILVSIAASNNPSLLINFLKKVGDVGDIGAVSSKALNYAVGWNLVDIAKALLEYLETPLKGFWFKLDILAILSGAVVTGNWDMIKLLLDSGADVNSLGEKAFLNVNASPLIVACQFGLTSIVRLLLGAGAKADLAATSGKTALHVASMRGFPSVCKLLIEHGATIELHTEGLSPLHSGARFSSIQRYKKVATTIMKALKDRWPRYKESGTQDADEVSRIINSQTGNKNKTAIIYAVVAGDIDLVESLIDLGASVNDAESDGYTALCRAAMSNNVEMTRYLLDNGANVDQLRNGGKHALHDACAWGSTKAIEVLLEKNAVADQPDDEKVPPIAVSATWGLIRGIRKMIPYSSKESISWALIHAARYGYHEITTALLDAGANINHQDEFGNTPLQFSCWNANSRVTQVLLARMPNIDLADNDGYTATTDAARRGEFECLKLLLDAGADTDVETTVGKRAITCAADVNEDCFRLLLERGAETVLPEYDRNAASVLNNELSFLGGLAYAFKVGAVKVYLEYIKPRVSEEALSVDINEALTAAVYVSKPDVIQLLLEYGADPNVINLRFDARHASALGIAIAYDNLDIVKLLLDNKFTPVDINKVDDYRNTPLHVALDWCATNILGEMIDLLLAHGADPTISSGTYGTVLNATCETSDDDIVRKILSLPGVSLDIPDDLGRLPLHLAAARRSYQSERFDMLTTKTSTARSVDKQGRNALHYVVTSGSTGLLEKLLKEYPDLIDVPDRDGWTPLHWSCRQSDTQITDMLIEHKASKQPRTHDRWTPLAVATYHGMTDQFEYLPEEDDRSDDDGIPSQAAGLVTNDTCDSCFCTIYGTGYRCRSCAKYWFCFKCYWYYEETHPKDHVFQRFDQESHDIDTLSTSETVADDAE